MAILLYPVLWNQINFVVQWEMLGVWHGGRRGYWRGEDNFQHLVIYAVLTLELRPLRRTTYSTLSVHLLYSIGQSQIACFPGTKWSSDVYLLQRIRRGVRYRYSPEKGSQIDHDDAVQLLTTLLYSQPLQYRRLRQLSPAQPAEDIPHVFPQHLDQIPVNESDPVTSTER